MRTLFIIIVSALSLFNLPAQADGMGDMSNMNMSEMHHDHNMMATSDVATPADYRSQGVIKRWDAQRVAIAHHAIPALNWPPMTMTFTVPQALAGQKLAVGTQVDFSFRQDDQGYSLTAIHSIQP